MPFLPRLPTPSLKDLPVVRPRLLLLSAFVLLSCTSTQQITKVGEKTYRLSCKTSLGQCLEQVDRVCTSGFKVQEGNDERRTYGVSVGSAQTEVRSSEALVRCHTRTLFGDDDEDEAKKPSYAKPAASSAPVKERICLPGSTQECIGGGGCRGGQACLIDGSAFGPCDCQAAAPEVSASTTTSEDATAPVAMPSATGTATPGPSPAPTNSASSAPPAGSTPTAPPKR
jgi:hypothetical protein